MPEVQMYKLYHYNCLQHDRGKASFLPFHSWFTFLSSYN